MVQTIAFRDWRTPSVLGGIPNPRKAGGAYVHDAKGTMDVKYSPLLYIILGIGRIIALK